MPKARKTEPNTAPQEQAVEPVQKTCSKTSTTKNTKTTKSESKPDVKTSNTKIKEEPVVPITDETEQVEAAFTDSFSEFMSKLQAFASQMNALKSEFRVLEKKAVRELKAAQKVNAKRKRKTSTRSPSGFVKPTLISNELATFLNKPVGTEMARTEVTREINSYIRAHKLQDQQNGRKINPDKSLATLLKIGNGEELTYFNLQRYMSPHFAKATSKPLAETSK